MRTLVIWSDIPDELPKFFVTDLDVSRFSAYYINSMDDEDLEQEMISFFYGDDEHRKFRFKLSEDIPPVTEFDKIIACGFVS